MEHKKIYLYDVSASNLADWLEKNGEAAYRGKQIRQWLWRGVTSFSEMRNISRVLRQKLEKDFYLDQLILLEKIESKLDPTTKYVWRLKDGDVIESVYMSYKTGTSVCVSSQVGCRMQCQFCASTKAGFGRNLSNGELLAQIALISKDKASRIDHIVVMGIGEPLENYTNLVNFLRTCNNPSVFNISFRKMTVSTCGIIPQMLKFAEEGMPVTLAISLHASRDSMRSQMMPINRKYPLEDLIEACREYINISGRRITFEYALFHGVNDSIEDAKHLAQLLSGLLCHVNLIPGNDVPGSKYTRSKKEKIEAFYRVLQAQHIQVTIRRELGTDIMAACGQLRRTSTR